MMHRGSAVLNGTSRNAGDAARSPPRSSRMGKREIMKQIHSFPILPESREVKKETSLSAIITFQDPALQKRPGDHMSPKSSLI